MCPEIALLNIKLKRQALGNTETLQEIMMDKFKDSNIYLEYLAIWAEKVIKKVAVKKDLVRRSLMGLNPDLLSYVGLGPNHLIDFKKA